MIVKTTSIALIFIVIAAAVWGSQTVSIDISGWLMLVCIGGIALYLLYSLLYKPIHTISHIMNTTPDKIYAWIIDNLSNESFMPSEGMKDVYVSEHWYLVFGWGECLVPRSMVLGGNVFIESSESVYDLSLILLITGGSRLRMRIRGRLSQPASAWRKAIESHYLLLPRDLLRGDMSELKDLWMADVRGRTDWDEVLRGAHRIIQRSKNIVNHYLQEV